MLPLAIPRMPASLSPIVTRAVKKFINLNIAEQLSHYSGPLRSLVDLDLTCRNLKTIFFCKMTVMKTDHLLFQVIT